MFAPCLPVFASGFLRELVWAVTEWFRPCGGWGVSPPQGLSLLSLARRAGPALHRPHGPRAVMAAPAYPGWVTRWVSGQWRNKKRPPTLRPPRTLALADRVANRREQGTGELPAARGRPGPGQGRAAGRARRCLVLRRARGAGSGRAGPWNWRPVLWEGSLPHAAALSVCRRWVRHVVS